MGNNSSNVRLSFKNQSTEKSILTRDLIGEGCKQLNEYVFELYKPTKDIKMQIVFFHGLQPDDNKDARFTTLMKDDGTGLWLNTWLVQEFPQAHILSVVCDHILSKEYDASTGEENYLREDMVYSLDCFLERSPVTLVLVGHGVGGLVLKKICLFASYIATRSRPRNTERVDLYRKFLTDVRGAFFFSIPFDLMMMKSTQPERGNKMEEEALKISRDFEHLRDHYSWYTALVLGEKESSSMKVKIKRNLTSAIDVFYPYYLSSRSSWFPKLYFTYYLQASGNTIFTFRFFAHFLEKLNVSLERVSDIVYRVTEPAFFEPHEEFLFFERFSHEPSEHMHTNDSVAWSTSACKRWPAAWLRVAGGSIWKPRIYFVTYDTGVVESNNNGVNSMTRLAERLTDRIITKAKIGQADRPIVLVGNSLDIPVIKALCVHLSRAYSFLASGKQSREIEAFLGLIRGIFQFETPVDDNDHLDANLSQILRIFEPEAGLISEEFSKLRLGRKWNTTGLGPLILDMKASLCGSEAAVKCHTDVCIMLKKMLSVKQPSSRIDPNFDLFLSTTKAFVGTQHDFDYHPFVGMGGATEELLYVFSSLQNTEGHGTNAVLLHGMGGIGKSTLGFALYREIQKISPPKIVLHLDRKAIVEPQGTIIALQRSMIQQLDPGYQPTEDKDTQAQLRRRLSNCYEAARSPLLIFIDNIENEGDLEDILPPSIDKYLPHGSYIIVTSRNLGLFFRLRAMGVKKVFSYEVKVLDDESAQKLFCKHARSNRNDSHVQNILKECRGLPLALTLAGQAASSVDSDNWGSILEQLRTWLPHGGNHVVNNFDMLYQSLEFSYNQLHETTKQAFRDIVFCFNGSPWNEMWVLFKDNLQILKRMSLIQEELRTDRESRWRLSTVKVHPLFVSLGLRKCSGLGSYMRIDIEEGEDIKQSRGSDCAEQNIPVGVLTLNNRNAFSDTSVPVYILERYAKSLRILVLINIRIMEPFNTSCLPERLDCFICANSSVPFFSNFFTKLNELKHVDIEDTLSIFESEKYNLTLPDGLKKLRLSVPRIEFLTRAGIKRPQTNCRKLLEDSDELPQDFTCKHLEELGLLRISLDNLPTLSDSMSQCLRKLILVQVTDLQDSFLYQIFRLESLESLSIQYCSPIIDLVEFHNMRRLENLHLALPTLKKLPDTSEALECLRSVTLENCSLLEELPSGFGTDLTPDLKLISIYNCERLKARPHGFSKARSDFQEWQYWARSQLLDNCADLVQEAVTATQVPCLISELHSTRYVTEEIEAQERPLHPEDQNVHIMKRKSASTEARVLPLNKITSDTKVKKINDNMYDLNTCEPGKETLIVILFHGVELNDGVNTENKHLTTWTYQDTDECWPQKMFKEDVELQKSKIVIRTLAACYDSSKYSTDNAGRVDIFLIGEYFAHTIIPKVVQMQKVSDRMIPIVLVAHSFGGLVVQEMISHAFKNARGRRTDANAAQFLKTLSGVFLYSTPHGALKDATYQEIYGGAKGKVTSDVAKLQKKHNKKFTRSREKFVRKIAAIEGSESLRNKKKIQIKSVFENLPTTVITAKGPWTGMILEGGTAKSLVIGYATYIDADHFNVCRPLAGDEGFYQSQYVTLRNFIQTVVEP